MAVAESLEKLKIGHPELAQIFGTHWHTRLHDYATQLYDTPPRQLEPELIRAFEAELNSLGVEKAEVDLILSRFQEKPVLQTSHHITPTHGPTFLALDLICLAGLQDNSRYLIGANSGVSFSNSAWSGALSYGSLPLETLVDPESESFRRIIKSQRERTAHGDRDSRISIIPARQRDQLVFGSELTDFQARLISRFNPKLTVLLPEIEAGQPFSHWSARAAAGIQNRIFDTDRILIFDINRVIARYLAELLNSGRDHPCLELLSDSSASRMIRKRFGEPTLFLGHYQGKKSNKVDTLTWEGSGLVGRKHGLQRPDRPELISGLRNFELCPGIFLLFFILRFINGIRCLGSFSQIGYLETFRRHWEAVNPGWNLELTPDGPGSLTTGRLVQKGKAVWPLDLAIAGQQLSVDSYADTEMGALWEPILKQLTKDHRDTT